LLSYPSSIALSNRTLNHLADLIRTHRHQHRSHWRRLNPGQQALLALAHLPNVTRSPGWPPDSAPPPPGATSAKRSPCSPPPPAISLRP
jgi:hypothetical protein